MGKKDSQKLAHWLKKNGLSEYISLFLEGHVHYEDLPYLTQDDLEIELGIPAIPSKRLLRYIEASFLSVSRSAGTSSREIDDPLSKSLPTYIAYSWQQFCAAQGKTQDRERLYRIVDTLDASIRFTTALGFGQLRTLSDGKIPIDIAKRIHVLIRAPTLGQWIEILRTITQETEKYKQKSKPIALHKILSAIEKHCQGKNTGETHETSLLIMRNALAHGGGFSRKQAADYVTFHAPKLKQILEVIVNCLEGTSIIARIDTIHYTLEGIRPRMFNPGILSNKPTDKGPWLVSDSQHISLDPLLAYTTIDNSHSMQDIEKEPVSQMYLRAEHKALCYTPIGVDVFETESESAAQRFRKELRLDEIEQLEKELDTCTVSGYAWHDFLDEAHVIAGKMIGRQKEIAAIKSWVKSNRENGAQDKRVGWISGAPGMGKSILMSKIAADLDGGNILRATKPVGKQKESRSAIFFHQFKSGDFRNSPESFLRHLRSALLQWKASTESQRDYSFSEDEMARSNELINEVARLIVRMVGLKAADSSPEQTELPSAKLIILIDGIDELIGSEKSLADMILQLCIPGTLWVISGRPNREFQNRISGPHYEPLFDGDLPRMNYGDIRAMLLEQMGEQKYQLLSLDSEGEGRNLPKNEFIKEVVSRSGGLPIYVHLLVEDLKHGRVSVSGTNSLPRSLDEYYHTVLGRLGVSDIQLGVVLIVAALAISDEPLDAKALQYVLAYNSPSNLAGSPSVEEERVVQGALSAARSVVRASADLNGSTGYGLFHMSFKQYILRDGSELRGSIKAVLYILSNLADKMDCIEHVGLRDYLFRQIALVELRSKQWVSDRESDRFVQRAAGRLCDSAFIAQMVSAWSHNSAWVFLTFQKVYFSVLPVNPELSDKIVRKVYDMLLRAKDGNQALSISSAHAVLSYAHPGGFYEAVLDMTEEGLSDRVGWPTRWNHFRLTIRRAHVHRKRLNGDVAASLLDQCMSRAPSFHSLGHARVNSELQGVYYDRAYLSYLKADFENARMMLEKAECIAEKGSETCDVWSIRCIKARFSMLSELMSEEREKHGYKLSPVDISSHPIRWLCPNWSEFKSRGEEFLEMLSNSHRVFKHLWEHNRDIQAQRWMEICLSHMVEAACLVGDKEKARSALDKIAENDFIGEMRGDLYLQIRRAWVLALEGVNEECARNFDDILRRLSDPCQHEEVSKHYFDAGWSHFNINNMDKAIALWGDGLKQRPDGGNVHWFGPLSRSIEFAQEYNL